MQVIKQQSEGQYRLQDMPEGTMPGIQRNETDTEIEVTY